MDAILNNLRRFPAEYGKTDDPAHSAWPELWCMMARVFLPNGKSREPARLTIQLGPQGVDMTLTDVTLGYKLVASCDHLDECFRVLQEQICRPTARWLPLRYGEGYQTRKQEERKAIDTAKNR
jgi:hypothetical protein